MIWCFIKKTLHKTCCLSGSVVMRKMPITSHPSLWPFLNYLNSFQERMFKLNVKFDAGPLLSWLSHFECDGHKIHMLTQQRLPPPPTSAMKLSLFTHAHSSPLSLAASLHECCANCSCYINNGWTFSGQTLYLDLLTHRYLTWNPWLLCFRAPFPHISQLYAKAQGV